MKEKDYLSLLLPEGLFDYFEIIKVDKFQDSISIQLEEKNIHPPQYKNNKLLSKGFLEAITIQDFPLRGKACFLRVKRRKWLNADTGITVCRDWDLVAKGTRMTQEFASFLKAINR